MALLAFSGMHWDMVAHSYTSIESIDYAHAVSWPHDRGLRRNFQEVFGRRCVPLPPRSSAVLCTCFCRAMATTAVPRVPLPFCSWLCHAVAASAGALLLSVCDESSTCLRCACSLLLNQVAHFGVCGASCHEDVALSSTNLRSSSVSSRAAGDAAACADLLPFLLRAATV
jgi:hypothetical protein